MKNFVRFEDVSIFAGLARLREDLTDTQPELADDAYAVAVFDCGSKVEPMVVVSHFADHNSAEAAVLNSFTPLLGSGTHAVQCFSFGVCKSQDCDCGHLRRGINATYTVQND